jgi:putative transposase
VFHVAEDRQMYFALLDRHSSQFGLSLLGWCLMTNHVHLLVRSEKVDSLTRTMKRTQSEYAFYVNRKHYRANGHLWQSRFYSCRVEGPYVWMTLRYIELNPVRAKLTVAAEEYPWSSAPYHFGRASAPEMLDLKSWQEQWSNATWREALQEPDAVESARVREATQRGLPLSCPEFVRLLEQHAGRTLQLRPVRRPRVHGLLSRIKCATVPFLPATATIPQAQVNI